MLMQLNTLNAKLSMRQTTMAARSMLAHIVVVERR